MLPPQTSSLVKQYKFWVLFEAISLLRKNIGRDLMAGMKSIVGGEIVSYTQMTDEARQVAEDRMVTAAQSLGADAVVAMRFASDSIAEGTIEILAYGTAVKFA